MHKIITTFYFAFATITSIYAQNVGIGTITPTNKLEVVSAAATTTNTIINATNIGTQGNAVLGVSNSIGTTALRGTNSTGTGVQAYTTAGIALAGTSLSGIAIRAQSGTGYALSASGNIKISGGNTNPSNNALLLSDAAGNATWKRSGIAFSANQAVGSVGFNSSKIEFNAELYDTQNNFVDYAGAVTPGSSVFTAPIAGIYHFSSSILFESPTVNFASGKILLMVNGNTNLRNNAEAISRLDATRCYLYIDTDIHLNANDKVWIEVGHSVGNPNLFMPLSGTTYDCRFNGELIFAD